MPPPLMAASTRTPPMITVYPDSDASFAMHARHDVETTLLPSLAPHHDASTMQNGQLNHTTNGARGSSPTKTDSSPMRPMTSQPLSSIHIPQPIPPNFTDSPQKNANFYPMYYAPPPPQTAPLDFPPVQLYDKENFYGPPHFQGMATNPYGEFDYGFKGPMKRTLAEPTPQRDRPKKQKVDKDEPFELPDPRDMPAVHDDGTKPSQSYAELIGMAILRAPNRRLTLAQIYKWISDHFSFYKASESGWQNSIRHNLSLNKNFIKQERPKDDPGKGNYWAIKPGEERPFLLGKKNPMRRITNPDGSHYISGISSDLGYPSSSAPAIGHFTLAPNPVKRNEVKAIDSAKFPDEADFSSDGTIAASDGAPEEDDKEEPVIMMPPPVNIRSSPPPVDIGSSPPPMASQTRKDTPPPVPRFAPTSRSGNDRRKFAGMNDSGYWSSIESSVARNPSQLLMSEADTSRPRLRKGRAEAEIARIRSSSIDSPGNDLQAFKAPTCHFDSSSPMRDDNPLTPAVVFKRPAKPPPSVSPNTNLRNHRNRMRALLGTPAKAFSPGPVISNWSPAFNIGDDSHLGLTPQMSPYKANKTPWNPCQDTPSTLKKDLFSAAFDIFIDAPEEDAVARGSPAKLSIKRPSLVRAATSAGILADITGNAKSNSLALAASNDSFFSLSPFTQRSGMFCSPGKLGSPLKQSHHPPTGTAELGLKWRGAITEEENIQPGLEAERNDALFGIHLPSDGSEEAIDIFQDFGKIGGAQQFMPVPNRANGSPVRRVTSGSTRPSIARSNTSRW
ncbi:hypothetical protein BDY17DRAFT_323316 [Neohortaea acidophila]|uniref:Fork-head domain-containing protein n=1 Tax=Neohortaea acidophila TaxID=245834 RepID=A0A6A6PWB8_9PEZI|nr:uncharacterized protein BDY17DRAFT_323316 [Neohortaea acidophila]KAF2484468.1 hypothetical protein BDY17DRAFT_323316 [Neohortaea acidophila]